MVAWAMFAWAAEFLLETSGAILTFRRFRLLSVLLAFRALADIFTFVAAYQLGADAYIASMWALRGVQYFLLCGLACQIVGRMIEERRDLAPYIVGMCAIAGLGVGLFSHQADSLMNKFLDAEISASALLAILITLGWAMKKMNLSGPWGWIAVGFLISVGGNALCALLWKFFPEANRLYPVPAIAALVIWNWSGLQRSGEAVRLKLTPKVVQDDEDFLREMGIGA